VSSLCRRWCWCSSRAVKRGCNRRAGQGGSWACRDNLKGIMELELSEVIGHWVGMRDLLNDRNVSTFVAPRSSIVLVA
jgi:hypothetical protein